MTDVADVPAPGPVFEIGTNVTGANTPDSFTPLIDGDELNIELGFQGLWMVVLAFRFRDLLQGQLTIITRIAVDGTVLGELGLAKQKVHPGGNGLGGIVQAETLLRAGEVVDQAQQHGALLRRLAGTGNGRGQQRKKDDKLDHETAQPFI